MSCSCGCWYHFEVVGAAPLAGQHASNEWPSSNIHCLCYHSPGPESFTHYTGLRTCWSPFCTALAGQVRLDHAVLCLLTALLARPGHHLQAAGAQGAAGGAARQQCGGVHAPGGRPGRAPQRPLGHTAEPGGCCKLGGRAKRVLDPEGCMEAQGHGGRCQLSSSEASLSCRADGHLPAPAGRPPASLGSWQHVACRACCRWRRVAQGRWLFRPRQASRSRRHRSA